MHKMVGENLLVEETLSQQPVEGQRNHHGYWYHLPSKFCKSNLWAVCLEIPAPTEGRAPFVLAAQ